MSRVCVCMCEQGVVVSRAYVCVCMCEQGVHVHVSVGRGIDTTNSPLKSRLSLHA